MTPRREAPLDAAALLRTLAAHDVDFLVIGGIAAQAHGHVRTTQNLDVLPSSEPANLARLAEALAALGATQDGADWPASGAALAARPVTVLDTRAGGIDVHLDPPGAAAYPVLKDRALALEAAGAAFRVVGLDDLIAMKRASGRPIDRADVRVLTEAEAADD